jgi:hypothetical protein
LCWFLDLEAQSFPAHLHYVCSDRPRYPSGYYDLPEYCLNLQGAKILWFPGPAASSVAFSAPLPYTTRVCPDRHRPNRPWWGPPLPAHSLNLAAKLQDVVDFSVADLQNTKFTSLLLLPSTFAPELCLRPSLDGSLDTYSLSHGA